MPLEDIPAFQEQVRVDITSASMRVYHPRESDRILDIYRDSWPPVHLYTRTELSSVFWGPSIDHDTVYVITARKPFESGQASVSGPIAQ